MQRITITIDDALLTAVDDLCARRGYGSRSEAVRDIVRDALAPARAAETGGSAACYGALSYVYSHGTRDLARRLTGEGHEHGVSIAFFHAPLGWTMYRRLGRSKLSLTTVGSRRRRTRIVSSITRRFAVAVSAMMGVEGKSARRDSRRR